MLPFKFEEIEMTPTTQVTRAQVPGGWLITILVNAPHGAACLTTTFVYDPEWRWEVKDEMQTQEA